MPFLSLASINSGSNGNCYYVGNDRSAVLIDAGISCRETERRMARLGLAIGKIRALFISHEHTDHTRGAEVLSRKYRIPVYITPETLRNSRLWLDPTLLKTFTANETVMVDELIVKPFTKYHDGIDPHSFTISHHGITAGVFTDIGRSCDHLTSHLSCCHAVFLESNYDEQMLENGSYPHYLKKRIRGGEGHLSNLQALELFKQYRSRDLKLLILSHLSAQNNHPRIVHDLFERHASGTTIAIASRYQETGVFTVSL